MPTALRLVDYPKPRIAAKLSLVGTPPLPPTRRTTDDLLREFLDESRRSPKPADVLSKILNEQQAMEKRVVRQLEDHEQKDDDRHTEIREAISGTNSRVRQLETRTFSPMPQRYDLRSIRPSDSGKVDLAEVQQELSEKFLAMETEVRAAKEREAIATARAQARDEAMALIEAQGLRKQKTLLFWLAVAGTCASVLTYIFTHGLKL